MKLTRAIPILLLAGLVTLAGCKKKPKTEPPPQAQPPVITTPEKPPTEPTQPQPVPQPTTPSETTAPENQPPVIAAPKPKPKKPVARKTVPPAPATPPKSNKTVVQEGGASEAGQLSAAIPSTEANHQQMNAARLLETTEANLKSITRALTTDEQAMVQQIRSYMQQSRTASADGDTERAYNLALKAHLLSDELVKGH